jgi:hypothetical protein
MRLGWKIFLPLSCCSWCSSRVADAHALWGCGMIAVLSPMPASGCDLQLQPKPGFEVGRPKPLTSDFGQRRCNSRCDRAGIDAGQGGLPGDPLSMRQHSRTISSAQAPMLPDLVCATSRPAQREQLHLRQAELALRWNCRCRSPLALE